MRDDKQDVIIIRPKKPHQGEGYQQVDHAEDWVQFLSRYECWFLVISHQHTSSRGRDLGPPNASLTSRLTRELTPKHDKPSVARPVWCSGGFGLTHPCRNL